MNLKEKIIFHIVELSLLGCVGYAYSMHRYYQGRIDANNEIKESLVKLKDELCERFNVKEEEA